MLYVYLGLINYLIHWNFVQLLSRYLTICAFVLFLLKFRKKLSYRKVQSVSDNTKLRLTGPRITQTLL